VLDLLKSMGPSSIDAEIRSLGPSAGGDIKLLELFMLFIERQIGLRQDFEFTEALLGLFLKVSDFRGTLLQFCCQSLPLSLQTPFSYVHEGYITFSITLTIQCGGTVASGLVCSSLVQALALGILCCVLERLSETPLSQCLSPCRCINGYRQI